MQPDQRNTVGRVLADDQRDMLARVVGAAEGDDPRIIGGGHGQPRARGDLQPRGIGKGAHIGSLQRHRFAGILRIDQKGGQHAGETGKVERGARLLFPFERQRLERPLERVGHVERRIGDRQRGGQVEPVGTAHQHRLARRGGFDLVGQLERRRARGRDQHGRSRQLAESGFDRLQQRGPFDGERPAVAQRVHRLRRAP